MQQVYNGTAVSPAAEVDAKPQVTPWDEVEAKSKAQRSGFRVPSWLAVVGALLLGFVVGALFMRHHTQAKQAIVAVNGVPITQEAFFNRLQAVAGPAVMHKMVEEQLQLQYAKKVGALPTEAEVNAEYKRRSAQPNFAQMLASSGQSPDDYKSSLSIQMSQLRVVSQGVTVTDADARQYYAAQTDKRNPNARFYQPEVTLLSCIETQNQAQALKAQQALANNTPFAMVVNAYSIDASRSNGGQLAPLLLGRNPLTRMPQMERAVFGLAVGQQLGPVQLGRTWWLFRCMNKTPEQAVPYENVKDECLKGATAAKGVARNATKIQSDFAAFRKSANLQAFWTRYQPALHGGQ